MVMLQSNQRRPQARLMDDYSGRRNNWTVKQRSFLVFARRTFVVDWGDLAKIFNEVFFNALPRGGLSIRAIKAQHYELAHSAGIELRYFPGFDSLFVKAAEYQGVSVVPVDLSSSEAVHRLEVTLDEYVTKTEDKTSFMISNVPGATQDIAETHLTSHSSKALRLNEYPNLMFRVFDHLSQGTNSTSGFCAGLFSGSAIMNIRAPDEVDDLLLQYAIHHFNREKVSTPFISFTDSLIWALQLAIQRSRKHSGPVYIAVVDGRIVSSTTRVLKAKRLVEKIKQNRQANFHRYRGCYEYVVYGIVPESAIIGVFPIKALQLLGIYQLEVDYLLRLGQLSNAANVSSLRKTLERRRLPMDEKIATAIAGIVRLISPDISFYHPMIRDFIQILVQNYHLSDENNWEQDQSFLNALKEALGADLGVECRTFSHVEIPCSRAVEH